MNVLNKFHHCSEKTSLLFITINPASTRVLHISAGLPRIYLDVGRWLTLLSENLKACTFFTSRYLLLRPKPYCYCGLHLTYTCVRRLTFGYYFCKGMTSFITNQIYFKLFFGSLK